MIVKIQRPLAGNSMNEVLISTEDDPHYDLLPLEWFPASAYPTLWSDTAKVYLYAGFDGKALRLGETAPEQDW